MALCKHLSPQKGGLKRSRMQNGGTIWLMTTADLEEAALHLPIEERAHLAQKLLESLDQPAESEIQQMWLEEARRRADEIDEGRVQLVSAEELEQRVQSLFK